MNRLSEDMNMVDLQVPMFCEILLITLFSCIDTTIVSVLARPLLAPFGVVFFLFFMLVREVHRRATGRPSAGGCSR